MNPTHHPPSDPLSEPWDDALSKAMKRLPDHRAPDTLIPRVQAQIRSRSSSRLRVPAWSRWPLPMRIAGIVCGAAVMAAAVWISAVVQPVITSPAWARASLAVDSALALVGEVMYWNQIQLAATCAAILLSMMYLTCIGLGTAVYQTNRRNWP